MIIYLCEFRNKFEEQFWLEHYSAVVKKSKGKILNKSHNTQLTALATHLESCGFKSWYYRDSIYVEISDEDYMFGVLSHE